MESKMPEQETISDFDFAKQKISELKTNIETELAKATEKKDFRNCQFFKTNLDLINTIQNGFDGYPNGLKNKLFKRVNSYKFSGYLAGDADDLKQIVNGYHDKYKREPQDQNNRGQKIIRQGNSLAISIPSELVKQNRLRLGQGVNVFQTEIEKHSFIVIKVLS